MDASPATQTEAVQKISSKAVRPYLHSHPAYPVASDLARLAALLPVQHGYWPDAFLSVQLPPPHASWSLPELGTHFLSRAWLVHSPHTAPNLLLLYSGLPHEVKLSEASTAIMAGASEQWQEQWTPHCGAVGSKSKCPVGSAP